MFKSIIAAIRHFINVRKDVRAGFSPEFVKAVESAHAPSCQIDEVEFDMAYRRAMRNHELDMAELEMALL